MEHDLTERVRELFAEAAERPPEERAAFLDQNCGNDHALRQDVLNLLHAYEKARDASFMAGATISFRGAEECQTGLTPSAATLCSERAGDRVGPYRLIERIGEGGFGNVYLAEQERPVRRRVALKVVKLGMDTRQVVARFEAERQALALMDHPNIARVLDAGATDAGRPYFVMELVSGLPITEYCDANRLGVRYRLELFVRVCRAVQHAHQKGIIHRDIKPSNILVAIADGQPIPKVIDFGIAKAVRAPVAGQTTLGDFKHAGTPQYMSPEQADLAGLDVDTRSDIYSLGVLLYELLTGTTPLDVKDLRGKPYGEIQRAIREPDPPFPSTRVTALGRDAAAVAKVRGVDPAKLRRLLQGELDWVVLKCLERDRAARYQTAEGLAKDVQRYLDGWPVVARRAKASKRLAKFALRNKLAVAVAGTATLLLVLGIVGTSVGLVRARRAQRESADLWVFVSGILTSAQPVGEGGGGAVTLVEALDYAASKRDEVLKDQPKAYVEVSVMLAKACRNLGLYARAEGHLSKAYVLSGQLTGQDSEPSLRVATELSEVRALLISESGMAATDRISVLAGAFARDRSEAALRTLGPDNPLTWDCTAALGEVLLARGEYAAAEDVFKPLLSRLRAQLGIPSPQRETPWYAEMHLPVVALRARGPSPRQPDVDRLARFAYSAARAMRAQQKGGDAGQCLWDAFRVTEDRVDPVLRARIIAELARLYVDYNKVVLAKELWKFGVAESTRHLGKTHPETVATVDGFAAFLERQGQVEEALHIREEQVDQIPQQPPRPHVAAAERLYRAALLSRQCGKPQAGDALFRRAIEMRHGLKGPQDETLQAWWRASVLSREIGTGGWKSDGLRRETWLTLDRRLKEPPPAGFPADPIDWTTLTFRLWRWQGETSGGATMAAEGNLDELKTLPDPPPGVYLLYLEARGTPGTLREVQWLLFAPWELALYELRTNGARVDVMWDEDVTQASPAERRPSPILSLASAAGYSPGGPAGRGNNFAVVANARLDLPPGPYRLSFFADDGVRAWLSDSQADVARGLPPPLINTWAMGSRPTAEARVTFRAGDGPRGVRVEFFQEDADYALRVRAKPDSPTATALVRSALVEGSDDTRRWLAREATLLEAEGRKEEAGPLFAESVDLGLRASPQPLGTQLEALTGLARYRRHQGDAAAAVELFEKVLTQWQALLGPSDPKTLRTARELAREHMKVGTAEHRTDALRLRQYVGTEAAKIPDQAIRYLDDCLASHPRDVPSLRERAILHGQRGKIDKAAADLAALLALSPMEVDDWYLSGVARLMLNDTAGYLADCQKILDRFGRSEQPGALRRVVKTCCLWPEPVGGVERQVRLARETVERDRYSPWSRQVLAMALYRAGEWQEVVNIVGEMRRASDGGVATNEVLAAMALHHLGNGAEARTRLLGARSGLEDAWPPDAEAVLPGGWQDWAVCRILLSEAERLIPDAAAAP